MEKSMMIGILMGCGILIGIGLCIGHFAIKNIFYAPRKTEEEAFLEIEKRYAYKPIQYQKLCKKNLRLINSEGHVLNGEYIIFHPGAKKIVILIHGYTGNHLMSLPIAQIYAEQGFNVLAIDARGHGQSEGLYPTYGLCEQEDVRLWVQKLRALEGVNVTVGLHGQSMGAATALMYAGKYNDIAFVVADCPYATARDVLQYQFKTFGHLPPVLTYHCINYWISKQFKIRIEDASPLEAICHYNGPIAFIHGKNDKTIPSSMSETLFKSRKNPQDRLLLVEGADHVTAYAHASDAYKKVVQEILEESNSF
ncbi:MAG: alpha/beta fold hydrolase [Niameybacter sp.]|uniref:alpha/beta hydrolase n=1 Tax=Niameybacter sp. TaxID=2033640 RepID=UPI002FC868F8